MNAEPRHDATQSAQIFISYARQDDLFPPDERHGKGFVTFLQEQLLYAFEELGTPRPVLHRDNERMERADQPVLEDDIRRSAILLVVLSPRWIASPWCLRELDTFVDRFTGYEAQERIVVVVRHNVASEEVPFVLRSLQHFPFFDVDPETHEERDLFVRGEPAPEEILNRIRELARHLWAKCRQLGGSTADSAAQGAAAEVETSTPSAPPPAPEVILEDPDRVLDLLFRFASRFPSCHEILVTTQLDAFRTARDVATKAVPLTPDVRAWLERLAAELGTEPIHPSPLWLAWMREVHLRKLVPVAQQLLAEWSPQPQAKNP